MLRLTASNRPEARYVQNMVDQIVRSDMLFRAYHGWSSKWRSGQVRRHHWRISSEGTPKTYEVTSGTPTLAGLFFGRIILPFTLLRRPECVLEPTRQDVRDAHQAHRGNGIDPDLILRQTTRHPFYHTSGDTLSTLDTTRKGQKTPIPTLECK